MFRLIKSFQKGNVNSPEQGGDNSSEPTLEQVARNIRNARPDEPLTGDAESWRGIDTNWGLGEEPNFCNEEPKLWGM